MRSSIYKNFQYIAIYCGIAFGTSWIIWIPLVFGKTGLGLLGIKPSLAVFASAGTLGPLIAAYITHRLETGNWRAVRFLPKTRRRLLWLFLGPALVLICWFVIFPALLSSGPPSAWHWHPRVLVAMIPTMFGYNLFGGPLFEEFGWRGFLQVRLQGIMPAWIAAIATGVIWSAWHLPLFLVHGWTNATFPDFLLILVGLSTVMAFAFNASEKLVIVAILMHSAFNGSPRFVGKFLDGTATRQSPPDVVLVGLAFVLTGLLLVILTRGRLAAMKR